MHIFGDEFIQSISYHWEKVVKVNSQKNLIQQTYCSIGTKTYLRNLVIDYESR